MHKKHLKSVISLSLAAVLSLLTACGSTGSQSSSASQQASSSASSVVSESTSASSSSEDASAKPPVYTDAVPLSDRSSDTFNEAAFEACCQKFSELSQSEGNEDQLFSLYDEIVDWLDCLSSDQGLVFFNYNLDVTNTQLGNESTSLQTLYAQKLDEACQLFRDLVNSDLYKDSFTSYVGEDIATGFAEYTDMTEEMESLSTKSSELVQEYNELVIQDTTDESVQTQIKELYIELVNTNNQMANCYGYDNYADFSYYLFGRDYTADDLTAVKNAIVENVLPLYNAYSEWTVNEGCAEDSSCEYTVSEDDMKAIPAILEKIDSSLSDSFHYLLEEGLYDLEASSTKSGSVFTSPLYSYKDAFIVFSPIGVVYDLSTIIHEFGHFNNFYSADHDSVHSSSAVDVSEIHSQGLELLFSDYYSELNSSYGEALKQNTYHSMLFSVLSSFMINEVETAIYQTEDLTMEKLDQIWADTTTAYGLAESYPDNSWVSITHLFENPCYYIGYATSALASLEIYTLSRSDWDSAVECYLQICNDDPGKSFCETLESAGLSNVFESENIENLCSTLAETWNISDLYLQYKDSANTTSEAA